MGKWKFRSRFYRWFRRLFPINLIYLEEIDNLVTLLEIISEKPRRILDLGTGIGETLNYLPDGEKRVLLDASWSMISWVTPRPQDSKIIGMLPYLPLKPNCVDLITCIGTSEYIPQKALLLHSIYQTLKPSGYAIITFSPKNILNRLRNLLGKTIYPLSGSTATDLMAAQGFYIVRAYRTMIQSQYLVQKL